MAGSPAPEAAEEAPEVELDPLSGELVSVLGLLNYQNAGVERTLVANGKLYTKRDGSGSDTTFFGVSWEPTKVRVRNARREAGVSLNVHGFELRRAPTALTRERFFDEAALVKDYFPEVESAIRAATGAAVVKAFDYNIRSVSGHAAGAKVGEQVAVQQPAALVHNDYTLTSGPLRLRQLSMPPKANDVLGRHRGSEPLLTAAELAEAESGRFAIVNLWRNITDDPVQVWPLACCDARTSTPDDLCVFEIHYADRVGENYFAASSPRHEWRYFPEMARDEALLLLQWDSSGALAGGEGPTFTLHTAFEDPSSREGAPDRESIEVRCICIFPPADGAAP